MSETDHTQQFAVSAESESETRTAVEARSFDFVVDEPAALGGTNDGPNPVEYLLGAWAGCLNVVAHTVGEERGIDIDGVGIEIEGDLDPRKFTGATDDVRAGYQEIRVDIDVQTDADADALDGFRAELEERCPVGDNIGNPTPTDVTVDVA
ncbi:OsmC family protein [Halorientalis brevis]|uniref:OsmC family protein n=1 Tax=Halorientalis brevis TaxID=1126241 RepID=A0ABD6CG88_9EURY|nr:OsmC family protein [Halorientalis brevis]